MTTLPRRSVVRPAPRAAATAHRLTKLRHKLSAEQESMDRWMVRLRRAFHSFEKHQQRVVRLQRDIRNLENT